MMGLGGFGMMGPFGGLIGLLFNLAILIGIVLLIVWAVKRFTSNTATANAQSPRELAQARYARGEINREQYQQILQDLS
jgi:putative membrane protein